RPGILGLGFGGGSDFLGDFVHDFGVIGQVLLGRFAALADLLVVVGKPGTGLFHNAPFGGEIQHVAGFADALGVHDVEFGRPEWRRDLVLDYLDPVPAADNLVALLDLGSPADIHPHRGVEFKSVTTGGGLRIAEHHANLHADLVNEYHGGLAARNNTGQ